MNLVSIALSIGYPAISGTFFFDDRQHPEPRQVNVNGTHTRPDYEITPDGSQQHWGGHEPFLREADRILQAILIPAVEIARREQAVRAVIHSGHLEGFADDLDWQAVMFEFVRGGIDHHELEHRAHTLGTTPDDNNQPEEEP